MDRYQVFRGIGIGCLTLLTACMAGICQAGQGWQPNGTRVDTLPNQDLRQVISDGSGGAFFFLTDESNPLDYYNLASRTQHFDASGFPHPGWTAAGRSLSPPLAQYDVPGAATLNSDGSVTASVRAQNRFWVRRFHDAPEGAGTSIFGPVTGSTSLPFPNPFPIPVPTLDSGNLIVWDNYPTFGIGTGVLFELRLDSSLTPTPGWANTGRILIAAPHKTFELTHLIPRDGGGAWLVYIDYPDTEGYSSTLHIVHHVVKLRDDGGIDSTWAGGDFHFAADPAHGFAHDVVSDGAGGLYCTWEDDRTGFGISGIAFEEYFDIYATHILADGSLAQGWPPSGLPVAVMPGRQEFPVLAPDGGGGVFVAWGISGGEGNGIHAQHLLQDGTSAPGWNAGGRAMFGPLGGYQSFPAIAADGIGGVFIAASFSAVGAGALGPFVYAQHVSFAGSFDAVWSSSGYRLDSSLVGYQDSPRLARAEPGAVILGWDRVSNMRDACVQKLQVGGVVATEASLAAQDLAPDQVSLTWQINAGPIAGATVERSDGDIAWRALATILPNGEGRLKYDDRDILPGGRYSYRLSWLEAGLKRISGTTAVTVPLPYRFSLVGAQPNPAPHHGLYIVFSLASIGPTTLELFDVAGRRVLWRALGSLEVGNHRMAVPEVNHLLHGLYWARLTQGRNEATARFVLID